MPAAALIGAIGEETAAGFASETAGVVFVAIVATAILQVSSCWRGRATAALPHGSGTETGAVSVSRRTRDTTPARCLA
jgi:hypothetical protein